VVAAILDFRYAFFSETTNMIKAKLYMNVHWMALYKLYVFSSDMKFKMVATASGAPIIGNID
jgi:membrane-anchored protein YejM (alkaline phosphatase superfamily)